MSLVITSNQDNENTFSQDQSIYSAYSYRNDIGSTYKIPPNSQVCLQSAKVNLDGRDTVSLGNSVYYDWMGKQLNEETGGTPKLANTTTYPIVQRIVSNECGIASGQLLELTTDEMAAQIESSHKEYHPNLKEQFQCAVKRNSTTNAFEGYDFTYDQNTTAPDTNIPTSFSKFYTAGSPERFTYTPGTGVFQRNASDADDPCVGIGLGRPLSLAGGNRDLKVEISDANGSNKQWAVGLSRDIPVTDYEGQEDEFIPPYFERDQHYSYGFTGSIQGGDLDDHNFFADYCVHRDELGFLRLTQANFRNIGGRVRMVREQVEYWTNASSDFNGAAPYNISTNASGISAVEFKAHGEDMRVFLKDGATSYLLTRHKAGENKNSYCKPIGQTYWCMHPVLFVGGNSSTDTNSLTVDDFAGVTLTDYDSRVAGKCGWFEEALLSSSRDNGKFLKLCEEVDKRGVFRSDVTTGGNAEYTPIGLNASDGVDYVPTMIVKPNSTYKTPLASAAEILGFTGRAVVNEGATTGSQTILSSDNPTDTKTSGVASIFVRLNGFGNQVLNARTKNKSTILAQLPTGDTQYDRGGRIFYEPNRDVWLDLNNPYEITTADFSIDLVYSNEQYAKVCQGQTIVVLYFRTKPNMLRD
jgi:hypothetical protein